MFPLENIDIKGGCSSQINFILVQQQKHAEVMYVVLEWVCQIWTTFSEAKRRHVLIVCTTFTIISPFGYYRSQIMVIVERECSKPAENHQTLITYRLQETLVLIQNIKIFGKASLLTLTNDLFVLWHSLRLPCIILHLCTKKNKTNHPISSNSHPSATAK